jgi:hypothetical protein
MANNSSLHSSGIVVRVYVALTAATVLALVPLAVVAPRLAAAHAWGHAIVVVAFAVLLPLRLRAARKGDGGALRAVAIISGALAAVSLVEGTIPDFFPLWMRLEMLCVAALMVGNVLLVQRAALGGEPSGATATDAAE